MTTAELINKLSCYNPSKQVIFRTKSGKMLDIKDVSLFVFYDDTKEDLLNLFPENENGRPVLGSDHILVIVPNGMYLPVASIENKNDWNQIHEWIPTLEEYFKKF